MAPSCISNLIPPYSPPRPLRSLDAGCLTVHRFNIFYFGSRLFTHQAPLLWNKLTRKAQWRFWNLGFKAFFPLWALPSRCDWQVNIQLFCAPELHYHSSLCVFVHQSCVFITTSVIAANTNRVHYWLLIGLVQCFIW